MNINYKILITIAISLILIGCQSESNNQDENNKEVIQSVESENFKSLLEENSSKQLLDVRTPEEYNNAHLKSAKNINVNSDNFESEIQNLNKEEPVFVYCASGNRSMRAANKLKDKGFKNIINLENGITGWKAEDFEVVNNKNVESSYKNLEPSKFKEMISNNDKLVLVDYNAEWCGPCKKLSPILDQLAETYYNDIHLLKVDVDYNPKIAKEYRITGLPTIHLYKKGELVWEHMGLISAEKLDEVINSKI